MLRDTFDIKVAIHDKKKKCLVFGFNSRLVIAEILSFVGERRIVVPLMQRLSHATRAYIFNADGL